MRCVLELLRLGLVVHQPWRCLCRGSEQMTMTRPCRLMTRHLLQIFFTLGLTFIVALLGSRAAVGPAPSVRYLYL
jgi:hypothetical protein